MICAVEIPDLPGYGVDRQGRVFNLDRGRELAGWQHYSAAGAGPYRRYEIRGRFYFGHRLACAVWNDITLEELDAMHVHHEPEAESTLDCRPSVLRPVSAGDHSREPGHMNHQYEEAPF